MTLTLVTGRFLLWLRIYVIIETVVIGISELVVSSEREAEDLRDC